MGMYNVIVTKKRCPKCNAHLEWQSKYLILNGYVLENLLQEITLNEYMDGEMHTFCDNCKASFEISIGKGKEGAIKPRVYKLQENRKKVKVKNKI